MANPVALMALIGEALIGYPASLYKLIGHPVGAFAKIINHCEARWNNDRLAATKRKIAGTITVIILIAIAAGGGWLAQYLANIVLPAPYSWIAIAILAIPGLAQKSLYQHVKAVYAPLTSGDINAARDAVGMIVGRDTQALDAVGVSRAAIESLAESFCDGIMAPAFWLILGGLPGLYAYKAINTADSMVGHKEEPYRAFGWAAARIDDVANFLPARIAGILLCLSAMKGWRTMWTYKGCHASPNAGWPEAAMAGALNRSLAGPIAYDNKIADKPWIGNGPAPSPSDIMRALFYYQIACGLLWLIAGGILWVG